MWLGVVLIVMLPAVAVPHASPGDSEKDVSFISRLDGTEQRYVLWVPAGVSAPEGRDVMVALHGHGSDRWQFIHDPRNECRAVRDVARKHGIVVVSPDYRTSTSWMGPAAEADVLQIIEEYRKQYGPKRVILAGGSMGAASALTLAALHPEAVEGVVAMNGIANHIEYANFQDAIGASFGGGKKEKVEEYKKRSAEYWPERLTMPIGLTVGSADEATPPQSVIRLAKVLIILGRDVLLIQKQNGKHETNYEDACAILEYVVSKTAATREE
jgi:pimeloyl-ACP methyl ester carboxylesterase